MNERFSQLCLCCTEVDFSVNSAISQGDRKGTRPSPTQSRVLPGPMNESPARSWWLKEQKRQDEMHLCYLLLVRGVLERNPPTIL